MFQIIPRDDLMRAPRFENIITTGSRVARWDKELMRDQDNVLFLRQDANNYELNHFLGILVSFRRTLIHSVHSLTRDRQQIYLPYSRGNNW